MVAIVNPICGSVQFLCFAGELLETLISVTSFWQKTAAEWHDPGTVAMVDIDTISSVKCQNSYGTSQFSQWKPSSAVPVDQILIEFVICTIRGSCQDAIRFKPPTVEHIITARERFSDPPNLFSQFVCALFC